MKKKPPTVIFENWIVPPDFESDGCSIPIWIRPIVIVLLKPSRAQPACCLHDFLSRHARWHGMKFQTIDSIFRRHLKKLGLRPWQVTIYWGAVKIARPFRRLQPPQPMKNTWQRLNELAMKQYGLKMTT